jgi:hypothetical protein
MTGYKSRIISMFAGLGGFSRSGIAPQIYSVAFTEAIVRALALASRIGDTGRTSEYAACVRAGLRFCNLLRLEKTQATVLGNPLRCKGRRCFWDSRPQDKVRQRSAFHYPVFSCGTDHRPFVIAALLDSYACHIGQWISGRGSHSRTLPASMRPA